MTVEYRTVHKRTKGHKPECFCYRCNRTFKIGGQKNARRLTAHQLEFLTGTVERREALGHKVDDLAGKVEATRGAVLEGERARKARRQLGGRFKVVSDDEVRAMRDLYDNAQWSPNMIAAVWRHVPLVYVRVLLQGHRDVPPA